jgi:3',5'-nucleoside bisphosphate phosphatase
MSRRIYLLLAAFLLSGISSSFSQVSNGVMRFDEQRLPQKRDIITIPDVNGYKVLKCDLHIHTVFSDGTVWPNIRLMEAWQEGLDVISLTDHMEYQPHKNEVSTNNNLPYEFIKNDAAKSNVILIKGAEITRSTPPGHFNAIFTGDVSGFVAESSGERDREAVQKASDQNAFIFWNHPGWKPNIEGSYEWLPLIEDLYKNKMLHGIEVFNGFGFHMKALDWCIDKGLTVMGNSDVHNLIKDTYDLKHDYMHRTMTLILARERSESSVKEALLAGRTVAWAGKYLAGKEENVLNLFNACVEISPFHYSEKQKTGAELKYYEIKNNSDLYFELELKSGKGTPKFILFPGSSQVISAESGQGKLSYDVVTAFVRSDKHLAVELELK